MIEEVEIHQPADAEQNSLARDAALTVAKVKFDLFRKKLQAAVDKYKSTLTYRVHERTSKKSGVMHPRLVDVNELQTILNNANYNVALKDDMLNYINDRDHFKRSKLSPLRRYVRNAVNQYIKEHNIESLELVDAILAMYPKGHEATVSISTVQESVDEDSESKFSDDLQAQQKTIKQQQLDFQQTQQRLQNAEREVERLNAALLASNNNQPSQEETLKSAEEIQRVRLELSHATASLNQANEHNRELELENKQQAEIINQQKEQISSLKAIISKLKTKVESLIVVVDSTFKSIHNMFKGVVTHLMNAVKEPKEQQEQTLSGAEFRQQIRKEMKPVAEGGGGPIHALIKEERDPATHQRLREEILVNYYADRDSVERALEEAKLLIEQENNVIDKTFDINNAGIGGIAPPPPPPPPPGEDAKKRVRVAKEPVKKAPAASPVSKPSVDINEIQRRAEARAARMKNATSNAAQGVKPQPTDGAVESPLRREFSRLMKKNPNLLDQLALTQPALKDAEHGDSGDNKLAPK